LQTRFQASRGVHPQSVDVRRNRPGRVVCRPTEADRGAVRGISPRSPGFARQANSHQKIDLSWSKNSGRAEFVGWRRLCRRDPPRRSLWRLDLRRLKLRGGIGRRRHQGEGSMRPPTWSPGSTAGFRSTRVSGSRSYVPICVSSVSPSSSSAMPRRAGMRATTTPREAVVTRTKSLAPTTPPGLPGPS
jgi:hypothetical protein